MANINLMLSHQCEEIYNNTSIIHLDEILVSKLYENIENENIRYIFSTLHHLLNSQFQFMNDKAKGNRHFNAEPSRDLLLYISIVKKLKFYLKGTELDFTLTKEYDDFLQYTETFLQETLGSEIPENYKPILIIEYEPIFSLKETIVIAQNHHKSISFPLKMIGHGSYANVYKFKDTYYNCTFALKKAFKTLDVKEIKRFEKEFTTLKKLDSPYILKVYRFNQQNNEYIMEYADKTISEYLEGNPTLDIKKRRSFVFQLLKGMKYIHDKKLLHRDISYSNILVKIHEDTEIIKISDFGLVKTKNSELTSLNTELKGSLNDPNLQWEGFANYSIEHETFALSKLIYFIMTNKKNLENIKNDEHRSFIEKGTATNKSKRFKDIKELMKGFNNVKW